MTARGRTNSESIAVSTNPKFIKIVERARAQHRAGLGYTSDELRRIFGIPKQRKVRR